MGFREGQAREWRRELDWGFRRRSFECFIVTPESANLWPLSLIVGTLVGMPPAFAGVYFGKFLKTTLKGRSDKEQS